MPKAAKAKSDRLKKSEAAKTLGVSIRTLENYVAKGLIAPSYQEGLTRSVAVFAPADVERLKNEMMNVAQAKSAKPETTKPRNETALVKRSEFRNFDLKELLQLALSESQKKPSLSDIAHKLTLSVKEAARLSGLSENFIRTAIKTKKLKAQIIGKGWRVKKADLESYIAKL